MPCHVEKPEMSFENHLELMLCKSCKYLNKEQIINISPNTGWIGLLEWYLNHLREDYNNNLNFNHETVILNIMHEDDKRLIIEEFKRLNLELILDDKKIKGWRKI